MGERALQKLLSLPGGSFELVPLEPPSQRTLSGSWETLLAEGARVALPNELKLAAPRVDAAKLAPLKEVVPLVAETLICTGRGEPLYDDGCEQAQARMQWLQAVEQQAARFHATVSLGAFDRLEIQFPDGRAVAQAREDRLIYVRVAATQMKGATA